MEPLPKIVRQRLYAAAQPETHPDADLLAAFAENSLAGREREGVLQHLALCADCREILSFAQPQAEPELAVAAAMPSRPALHWFQRPMLRWGALAACALVVGSAVLLHYQPGSPRQAVSPAVVAMKSPEKAQLDELTSSQADEKAQVMQQAPRNQPQADLQAARELALKKQALQAPTELAKSRPPQAPVRALPRISQGGFAALSPWPDGAAGAAAGAMAPPLSAKVTGGAAGKEDRKDAAPPQGTSESVEVTAAAAPAVSADTVEISPVNHNQPDRAFSRKSGTLSSVAQNSIAPHWALSSDGSTLLRSLDSGKSWQTIPVAGNVVFRSVAAVGLEVWAGGSGGALYHSADAGQHWIRVTPIANGQVLASDIVRIEFTDAAHGSLTTAAGAIWTTADGGRSWQLPYR